MSYEQTSWSDWPFNYGKCLPEFPRLTDEQMAAFNRAARKAADTGNPFQAGSGAFREKDYGI